MELQFYFFKNRKEEIDAQKFFEFFSNSGYKVITEGDTVFLNREVEEMEFKFSFVITQNNTIKKAYTLDSLYESLNMSITFDVLLPFYIVEQILKIIERFTKRYRLFVYTDYFKTIYPFDYKEILEFYVMARTTYIEEMNLKKESIEKYRVDSDKLYDVCKYQELYKELISYYKNSINVFPYIILLDKTTDEIKLAIAFNPQEASVFPPYIDLIYIISEQDIPLVIAASDFYKYANRYLSDVPGFVKGTRILKHEGTKKIKKVIKKLSSSRMNHQNYKRIKLTDCIDDF